MNDFPSFWAQCRNFSKAINDFAKDKYRVADESKQKKRLETCFNCDFIDGGKEKCTKCGCIVKFKVYPESQNCPENLWDD